MVLFWDKNIPRTIPEALLLLKPPVEIKYYLQRYPLSDSTPEGGDDRWLSEIGTLRWTVITQDYHLHERETELYAMKQHKVGCFYLWGAEANKWEIMRCFARAYDRIIAAVDDTPSPFIYRVTRIGLLRRLTLP